MDIQGFDTNTKLSYSKAKAFKDAGFEFVMRYVGRYTQNILIDLDKIEVNNIMRAGLILGIVQHCPGEPGIIPTVHTGMDWGRNAVIFSKQCGVDLGTSVSLDLENVNDAYAKKPQEILAFCNAWCDEVKPFYKPLLYVGFDTFLTSSQLYYKLKFTNYWKSFSKVPDIDIRGYCMTQYAQTSMNGILIDRDVVRADKLGGMPQFMVREISTRDKMIENGFAILATAGIDTEYWRGVIYFDELLFKMINKGILKYNI